MTTTLPQPYSLIEALFADYEAALAEKRRVYALAEQADDASLDAAEAASDAAYEAVEAIADAILAFPIRSKEHAAIKARVLLARGSDPADLLYYRPEDLSRFLQEIGSLAQL